MSTVLLLILLFVSIIMTGLILIQQSEGGALGIGGGGGGGGGGFMSGRSAANSVSRMTGILGCVFLVCCLLLSIVFNKENQQTSILDEANVEAPLTTVTESVEDTLPLADENDAATEARTTADTETPKPDETATEETPESP
ncbi:MAG: preprotein translocase subunit SecG [Alphaproteobacteria bacterium]